MNRFKTFVFSLLLIGFAQLHAQSAAYEETIGKKSGTIEVHYFDNSPTAYLENGVVQGIEVDILEEFKKWLMYKKAISISYNYTPYSEFEEMITSVKSANGNTMGVGTVTITDKRKADMDFSAPYMKNVSILITDGQIASARTEKELHELLSSMQAVTVKGSIHEDHLKALYAENKIAPNITYVKEPSEVFEKIKKSTRTFGYVDVITFWKYLKENDHYIKMHSIASYRDENFGFIFPKNSGWSKEFNEFFESGFGFTSTKEYRKILEKHLSFEVLNAVELNP